MLRTGSRRLLSKAKRKQAGSEELDYDNKVSGDGWSSIWTLRLFHYDYDIMLN